MAEFHLRRSFISHVRRSLMSDEFYLCWSFVVIGVSFTAEFRLRRSFISHLRGVSCLMSGGVSCPMSFICVGVSYLMSGGV